MVHLWETSIGLVFTGNRIRVHKQAYSHGSGCVLDYSPETRKCLVGLFYSSHGIII